MGRGRTAPARRGTPPRAALAAWIGGHLAPTPGGQEDGQTAHQRAGLRATGWMLGNGWTAPGQCAVPPWGGSGRAGGRHLVTAPGSPGGRPDRPTGGPNAGQGLDGSRAVRCGSLGGFGRVNGRHLDSALVGQLDGTTGRPRAEQKAACQNALHGPDGSGAARCGSLGGSGRADGRTPSPAPGGQEDGQACHRRAW